MSRESEDLERARAAKATARRIFEERAELCGIGITRQQGRYALAVRLEREPDEDADLPREVDGVPVLVRVVGRLRKQHRAARR